MPTLPMNVGFQGQSGSNANIAEPSLLTRSGSRWTCVSDSMLSLHCNLTGGTHGTFDPCIADGLILRRRVLVVAAQGGDRDGPIWSRKQCDPGPRRHY